MIVQEFPKKMTYSPRDLRMTKTNVVGCSIFFFSTFIFSVKTFVIIIYIGILLFINDIAVQYHFLILSDLLDCYQFVRENIL